jgi:hypothetical protein
MLFANPPNDWRGKKERKGKKRKETINLGDEGV